MRSYVSRPFLLVLPNVSDEGILVAELHRTFIALKFPLFGMNLEVNLEIRNMFQTQPALPLCYARVTLSVMAQTFLQGEKMLPTVRLGTDQHSVTSKHSDSILLWMHLKQKPKGLNFLKARKGLKG